MPFWYYIILIVIAAISIFIMIWLSKQDWYNEMTDESYKLYRKAYLGYQYTVLPQKKRYERFVEDFCHGNIFISSPGKVISSERLNKRNQAYNSLKSLLENRTDLVEKYFFDKKFGYKNYLELLKEFDTTIPDIKNDTIEDKIALQKKLEKVREEILKYENEEKTPKHYGQRMFGYLIKAKYFPYKNDEQHYEYWKDFTGIEQRPEMSYLRNPEYNKNSMDKIKFESQIKEIQDFFYLIDLKI